MNAEALLGAVERLAAASMVSGVEPRTIEEVRGILAGATETGWRRTAAAAAELSDALAASGDVAALDGVLRDGVARLQHAVGEDRALAQEASLADDPELLASFVIEAREHLGGIEHQVLTLEQRPDDPDALNSIFRGFHTIKGVAGFLEFDRVRDVAHEAESLLDLARNRCVAIGAQLTDAILGARDYLARAVDLIEDSGGREFADPAAVVSRIRTASGTADSAASAQAKLETVNAPTTESPEKRGSADRLSIRVDIAKLDYLMDMVGEMVIAQSMVGHDPDVSQERNPRLARHVAQLARITTEVQRTTMRLRMIPIGQLFSRSTRLVRDLSRKTGKRVRLEFSGEDTELDKTILEELADPLMHMVRNAVDHGIETPAEREAAGKAAEARILMAARHEGGQIVIEVADDGRGLDRQRILAKARDRGLVSSAAELDAHEILELIFQPGFSTAAQVTDVSGRGVGMDVVRRHVETLRGRVEVESNPGAGTRFYLRLPLTLAIIDGLVVGLGKARFVIPLYSVLEMFRPTCEQVFTVEGAKEMVLVRGTLLPLVRLARAFGVAAAADRPEEAMVIVAESQGRRFCVMVDSLIGKQELVIKSLGEALKNVAGVAGAAILGDGRVGLIADLDRVYASRG